MLRCMQLHFPANKNCKRVRIIALDFWERRMSKNKKNAQECSETRKNWNFDLTWNFFLSHVPTMN